MSEVLILVCKTAVGGLLVVAFALLGETLKPKRFAGLFSAAPAVAIAGMTVTLLSKGSHDVRESAIGMLAGCAGMTAYAAAAMLLLRRMPARAASALAMTVWVAVAGVIAWALL